MTLRLLAIEVYKCVNNFNPEYLNEMFTKKNCPYDLRDTCILERLKAYTTQYGPKSFRNYGAKIWLILYKFWCLRRILCHLYYDHIYTCANLFNVLFQCECHCFYSCRIIAVPQLRLLVYLYPTLNKLYLILSYLNLSYWLTHVCTLVHSAPYIHRARVWNGGY